MNVNKAGESSPALFKTVEKATLGFFDNRMQPATRTHCPLKADNSHTRGLISIFPDAHVAGKNMLDFFCACGRKLCEAFFDKPKQSRRIISGFVSHYL